MVTRVEENFTVSDHTGWLKKNGSETDESPMSLQELDEMELQRFTPLSRYRQACDCNKCAPKQFQQGKRNWLWDSRVNVEVMESCQKKVT